MMATEIVYNPYNLNPLMRNVLITNAEVIFHAPTKHTFDPRMIQNAIIIAEERFIVPALGRAYYNKLVNTKNVVVDINNQVALQNKITNGIVLRSGQIVNSAELLADADKKLWYEILWKLVAECVIHSSYTDNWVQVGSEGPVHNRPTSNAFDNATLTSPDLNSVKFILDKKLMDRIDPLLLALQSYICFNKLLYPLYTGCPTAEAISANTGKKTQWVTGLYDEPEKPCDWDIMTREALVAEQGGFIFTDSGNDTISNNDIGTV